MVLAAMALAAIARAIPAIADIESGP